MLTVACSLLYRPFFLPKFLGFGLGSSVGQNAFLSPGFQGCVGMPQILLRKRRLPNGPHDKINFHPIIERIKYERANLKFGWQPTEGFLQAFMYRLERLRIASCRRLVCQFRWGIRINLARARALLLLLII